MEIQISLRRLPAEVTVGQRLGTDRFRLLVGHARAARVYGRLMRQVLRDPGKPILFDGKPAKVRLKQTESVIEKEIRMPARSGRHAREQALWVIVCWTRSTSNEDGTLPELAEIAQLRDAGLTPWALFLRKYGLIELDREWVVAFLPERHEYILRIPLNALSEIAEKAAILVAAEKAAAGDPEEFQDLPFNPPVQFFFKHLKVRHLQSSLTPSRPSWKVSPDPVQEARRLIGLAIEEAMWQFEARVEVEESDRGLASRQTLYTRGYWPLVVLSEFLPRVGYVRRPFNRCQAHGCRNEVRSPFRKYCSRQCYERQKKRNLRWDAKTRAAVERRRPEKILRMEDTAPRKS